VPDERHEAMRDLVRARDTAVKDYRIKRQNVSSLLRLGRHYPGKKTWGRAHINWLTGLKLEHYEQRIAFEEMLPRMACTASMTGARVPVRHGLAHGLLQPLDPFPDLSYSQQLAGLPGPIRGA
jgi:hypothetical protein